jgi:DNA adenine methylase
MDCLKFQVTSRREFERLKARDHKTLTDLERAARFIYLQKTAFGGKVTNQNFGVDNSGGSRFNLTRLAPLLEDIHERLSGVVIECLPWAEFMRRWDRPGMLFYLDPPYWDCETDCGTGVFSKADFEAMADNLKGLRGRFILSLNDIPEVRRIFKSFEMETVDCTYSIRGGKGKSVTEVVIFG